MYAQKEALWGKAPPFKNYFIGKASSGRDRNLRSNTDSQLSDSLSGSACKSRELGVAPKDPSPINIWLSLEH